ncbi:MAG: cysteine desulfurase family protein [Vicinamibacteraceae bacterium]
MAIYLDHNSTTPVDPMVADAMDGALRDDFGNASSVHAWGQRAKARLDGARAAVAALVGGDPTEIVFTGSGTEADVLAVRGAAEALEAAGRRHLVVSTIEHEAVLQTARALARRGWEVSWLGVDASGVVDPAALEALVTDRTALVSVMHANNEVGTIQPIAALAAVAHARGALFHTDAVQAAGKVPIDATALGVDLLAISGHKFSGPKGTGALWVRRGTRLMAQMTGGRQERSRRAGTENVPGLVGLGVAALRARTRLAETGRIADLRDTLERDLLAAVPGTHVNGRRDARVANTSNVGFEGIEAESLVIAFDLEGIAVSTGSACSSGTLEPSHVLKAMGLDPHDTQNAIRFSLGFSTTTDDIARVVAVAPGLVERLRTVTAGATSRGRDHVVAGREA